MRKLFTLIAALLLTASVFAQSPEKMSYQAVIRDASDNLVTDTQVGMQISILQGSASGTPVYVETQTPTTNANGLVSIEIGGGAGFNTIDWSAGPYFIKTETDPTGGTSYTITGTSQLLSVPYALHAKTAETVENVTVDYGDVTNTPDLSNFDQDASDDFDGDYNNLTNTPDLSAYLDNTDTQLTDAEIATMGYIKNADETDPVFTAWDKDYADLINTPAPADGSETKVTAGTNVTVTGSGTTASPYVVNATGGGSSNDFHLGQDTLGGIVFYIYLDQNGDQHGLIVSKTETTAKWQNTGVTTNATRSWDGAYNMNLMSDSPAKDWVPGNFSTDWCLPSIDELSILWHNRFHANNGLNDASATLLSNSTYYWSSTEYSATLAFTMYFSGGFTGAISKTSNYSVRAVRAF